MIAENKAAKALKKQQQAVKTTLQAFVTDTTNPLLSSAPYDFTTAPRTFVATTLPLSEIYSFGPAYANVINANGVNAESD